MIKDYIQIEQTSFRAFLGFSIIIWVVLIPSFYLFSSYWRVETIKVEGSSYINEYQFVEFYNNSIWTINDNSFKYFYDLDPTIEFISHEKELPNQLNIKISHYLQVAEITDLR